MKQGSSIAVVQDPNRAAVLLHPTRLKILEGLKNANSAAGLARALGEPRQKINYHLRELEKEKLVELVEERRKGNCTERVLRAVAHMYMIDPAALGTLGAEPGQIRDRFSSTYLVAVAARTIRDLAVLRDRAERAGKKLATFTLETEVRFPDGKAANAFAEELATQLGRLIAKYHDERAAGGRSFQVVLAGYPKITKTGEGERPVGQKR